MKTEEVTQSPPPTKAQVKKDMTTAAALMTKLELLTKSQRDLVETINEELKGYEAGIKEVQKQLIEIGERNRSQFDEKERIVFEEGYLLLSKKTEVKVKKTFDLHEFATAKPNMVSIELKVKPIKDAFLDEDQRKELSAFGVSVTTEKKVQVKLNGPDKE
jgi:phosphoenolpyruvate-protein kinase (PTS system EI component)